MSATPPPASGEDPILGLIRAVCLWLGLLAVLLLSGILLWFADLRENQMFWRNAGGYPVELRDLVETSFYPLGLATCTGIFLLGWALLYRSRGTSPGLWLAQVLVLVLSVMIVVGAGVVAFSNNVGNLWNHRPLHAHPEQGVDE